VPKNKEECFGDTSKNMMEEAELARNVRQIAVWCGFDRVSSL